MLVGTITDAWSAISKIGSGYSLPPVPQVPSPTTYPLPMPTVQSKTSAPAPSPTYTQEGKIELSFGPNWKMIGLVAGSVAALGTLGYFLLRKPRRRRRRR